VKNVGKDDGDFPVAQTGDGNGVLHAQSGDGNDNVDRKEVMKLLSRLIKFESSRVKSDKARDSGERKDSKGWLNEMDIRMRAPKKFLTEDERKAADQEDKEHLLQAIAHTREQIQYYSTSKCMLQTVVNSFPAHCGQSKNTNLLNWRFYSSKTFTSTSVTFLNRNDFTTGDWFLVDENASWSSYLSHLASKVTVLRKHQPRLLFRTIGNKMGQWQIRVQIGAEDVVHDLKVDRDPGLSPCIVPIVTVSKFLPYSYVGAVIALHALCYLFGGDLQVSLELTCSKGHGLVSLPQKNSANWDDYIEGQIVTSLGWKYRSVDKVFHFIIDPQKEARGVQVKEFQDNGSWDNVGSPTQNVPKQPTQNCSKNLLFAKKKK
jgi:hypothetical protein